MKKLAFLFAIFPIFSHAYSNEPDGFRGYKWGDSYESHQEELNLIETSKSAKLFTRNNDKLSIGGANLSLVHYMFGKFGLSAISIKTDNYTDSRALIAAFQEQFGTGAKSNRYIEKYIWQGTHANVILDCGVRADKCTAILMSNEVYYKEKSDLKSEAAAGSKDF